MPDETSKQPPPVDKAGPQTANAEADRGQPVASREGTGQQLPAQGATPAEVARFIEAMRSAVPTAGSGSGRLVFAMDATMSREPTWDMALGLQAEMFDVVREVGGLEVQLVYFRGAGECRASRWVRDAAALARLMTGVQCRGGYTQIGKVLGHVRGETEKSRVAALVYVGDCMEEAADEVCGRAGELALLGVPVFVFQEGDDAVAARTFREIASITHGAYCRFDQGSAAELRQLLRAVATFAAGGRKALERLALGRAEAGARRLLSDMRRS